MIEISASVGKNGANKRADVFEIQHGLNQIPQNKGGANPKLKEDGWIGPKTIGAIIHFQKSNAGLIQDGRIDVKHATLARINSLITTPKFSDKNLYGPGGPSPRDIIQDSLGDCFFLAPLGALAMQNPAIVRGAIHYDSTKWQFRVKLHNWKGEVKYIWVTQSELQNNVNRQGGSTVDNTGKYERIWPTVIETAYAKLLDTNHSNGLDQGYRKLNEGGWAAQAFKVLTGDSGKRYGPKHAKISVETLGAVVSAALKRNKSVTLSTDPEKGGSKGTQDGLVDDHVYMVSSIKKAGTDWKVTVRNPWGTNMGVGEGQDTKSAVMTVSLSTLVSTGGLEFIQIR